MGRGILQGSVIKNVTRPPAFFVYKDADQTIAAGATNDVIDWEQTDFNDNTDFDLTNMWFLPTYPGRYSITVGLFWDTGTARFNFFKNGSVWFNPHDLPGGFYTSSVPYCQTILIEMNGVDDYLQGAMDANLATGCVLKGTGTCLRACYFTGHWVAPLNP